MKERYNKQSIIKKDQREKEAKQKGVTKRLRQGRREVFKTHEKKKKKNTQDWYKVFADVLVSGLD